MPKPTAPSVLHHASPRSDILEGELQDGIFAADFADVAANKAASAYQDAATFFHNTYPSQPLKQVVGAVFKVLNDPHRTGGVIRLSTGFGGGKSHTLITLYHLAHAGKDSEIGHELLAASERPATVHVVAVDASRAGVPEYSKREGRQIRSLWGDVFYQLAGERGLQVLGQADDPEASPSEAQLDEVLPEGPVLFLLDELVIYMGKLTERGSKNLMGFLNLLATKCGNRPQTVMVVTDPAAQRAYEKDSQKIDQNLTNASNLDDLLGRKSSDYDAIGNETAQVIVRRLFAHVDKDAAKAASEAYKQLYERVAADDLVPLPKDAQQFADRMVDSWPLHPRLLDTVQDRLSIMPNFQKGRGVLRLFARILRGIYERNEDLPVITAGDVPWDNARVQGDLLDRLGREEFKPAVNADVNRHASELDGAKRGIHTRVASALLLESLAGDEKSGLSSADATLAVLRPSEAGTEPGEALDHLVGQCWHTYPMAGGDGWQFRAQPNVVKQIGERMAGVSLEDARRRVLSEARQFFSAKPSGDGLSFHVMHFPEAPHLVPNKAALQLVVSDSADLAKRIVTLEDDRDGHDKPRLNRNAIVAIAPGTGGLDEAVTHARRLIAAEAIRRTYQDGEDAHSVRMRDQIRKILTDYEKRFRLQTRRTFTQVVLPSGIVIPLDEEHLVGEQEVLQGSNTSGQQNVSDFLRAKGKVYVHHDALDADMFLQQLSGATPQPAGAYTTKAVHERLLAAPGMRLIDGEAITRNSIRKAVEQGRIAVRLPDGTAQGLGKTVSGPESQRREQPFMANLSTLSVDDRTLVAPVSRDIAKEWLKVDEMVVTPPPGPGDDFIPPPPPTEGKAKEATASSVEGLQKEAQKRPLKRLNVTTKEAEEAKKIQLLASQVDAQVTVTVSVEGQTSDHEQARLELSNMRLNHTLKPLDTARMLLRALTTSTFSAKFTFTFESPADEAIVTTLAAGLPSKATVQALFGEEKA